MSAPKERTLLTHLLLHANERVSIDRLLVALWGERTPSSGPKLVQLYVSNLRRELGLGAITTTAGGYRLDVTDAALDSLRFLALVAEGRSARLQGRPRVASAALREALSLWRGEAVAGGEECWEAARLEDLRLECLEEWLTLRVELGAHDEALPALVRLCDAHPHRERPRAQLMLALYRAGRQTEALEVFRDARGSLDELGLEPGEELRALERAILRHDPGLAPPRPDPPLRLPAPRTALIGREREREELRTLLAEPDVRLLSLVGAGGSGKTRLALAVANDVHDLFADGVALVELGAIRRPTYVVPAIAAALGIPERSEDRLEDTLAESIGDRRLLLLLDNFEQVVEAGSLLVGLLEQAPRLTLLVTSRRVLHLSDEHVFPVPPLPEEDAVALFLARARESGTTGEQPTADALADIREICRRVDGLPLAIELAAARARLLTPGQLLERLRDSVTVLSSGPRDLPARQQTLRDTLGWSLELLEAGERRSLTDLSVFPAGWSLDAADRVAGTDLERLGVLVDHSLVEPVPGDEEPRFRMLETVREYAAELLGDRRAELERRHAGFFIELAEAADLRGPDQQSWLDRLDREHDNLRATLDHAAAAADPAGELRLVGALWRFWWLRGELAEGRSRLEHALARGSGAAPALVAQACAGAAGIAWSQGDPARARELAEQGLGASGSGDGGVTAIYCHTVLGLIGRDQGDFEGARTHLEESQGIADSLGRESDVNVAKMNLGSVAFDSGAFGEAVTLWQEVLAHHRERAAEEGMAIALLNLGLAAHRLGRGEEAGERFAEAERLFDRIGFREYQIHALHGLAAVAAAGERGEEAASLLGRAASLLAESGSPGVPFAADLARDAEASARALMGDEAFTEAFAAIR